MTARWCVAVLLLAQLGALLIATQAVMTVLVLATLVAAGTLGVKVPFRHRLQTSPPYVLLAVLEMGKLAVLPYNVDRTRDFVNTPLTLELGTYCILSQTLILFGWPGKRLPMAMPFVAGIGMVSLFNIRVGSTEWTGDAIVLLGLAVIVALATAIFFRRQRSPLSRARKGLIPLTLALVAAGSFGIGTSMLLHRYEGELERAIVKLAGWEMNAARVGFSHQGSLENVSNWKTDGDDRVALRVMSKATEPPGYLRGRSFGTYEPGKGWQLDSRSSPIAPLVGTPPDLPEDTYGRFLFELTEPTSSGARGPLLPDASPFDVTKADPIGDRVALEVWPAKHLPAGFFITPSSTHLAAQSPTLARDLHGNLDRDKEDRTDPFTLLVPPGQLISRRALSRGDLTPIRRSEYLGRPTGFASMEETIREYAADIFTGADTVDEKIAAVTEHFQTNYQWELGSAVDPYEDPVVDFLKNRTTGHCELFASASVLLLRQAGVPARYTTGLVVREWNNVGQFWVARDRDAHAWAEAWDDETNQWILVESTPVEGVPNTTSNNGPTAMFDALRLKLWNWQRDWAERNLQDDFLTGLDSVMQAGNLLAVGIIAAVLALVLRVRQGGDESDPRRRQLALMRQSLERRLARHGLRREDTETVADFADKIAQSDHAAHQEAAAWLRRYARTRYRPSSFDDAELDRLRQQHQTLRTLLRRKPKTAGGPPPHAAG